MNTVLRSPGIYFQKPGAVNNLFQYVQLFGKSALMPCTQGTFDRFSQRILEACPDDCSLDGCIIGKETTNEEILKVTNAFNDGNYDVIVGIGGGKAIDTARAASDILNCPLIIVPTVASNDSPCSALSIIHDEGGAVIELRTTKRNPDVVLVDTDILVEAPERLFVAGMGDALATWFEARACSKSVAKTLAGDVSSEVALTLSKLCFDTLMKYGRQALNAVRTGLVNDDFDRVILANIYLSGVGFESGGVAAAHAVNDGFSARKETAHLYHGEIVGFGVLAMMMLEEDEADLVNTVLDFMIDVGLPVSFDQLGIKPTEEMLLNVADVACHKSVMGNMPFEVTPADVVRAIVKADLVGTAKLKEAGVSR